MHKEIYKRLRQVARANQIITYSKIAPMANLDMENPDHRKQIGEILGAISEREFKKGRPLLSAVVVHLDNNRPGKGFFNLAEELGIYDGTDDLAFHIQELDKVHKYWKKS